MTNEQNEIDFHSSSTSTREIQQSRQPQDIIARTDSSSMSREVSQDTDTSQQPITDSERMQKLLANLEKLSRCGSRYENTNFAALTIIGYYKTKLDSPKFFEKNKAYWEEQKIFSLNKMNNNSQITGNKHYQNVKKIIDDLEILATKLENTQ